MVIFISVTEQRNCSKSKGGRGNHVKQDDVFVSTLYPKVFSASLQLASVINEFIRIYLMKNSYFRSIYGRLIIN